RSKLSRRSNDRVWLVTSKNNFPLPMVSGRSVRMGPRLCGLDLKTPVSGSQTCWVPEAGDGFGRLESCVATEELSDTQRGLIAEEITGCNTGGAMLRA